MTAPPKFGDAIAVGGVRPAWLVDGVTLQYRLADFGTWNPENYDQWRECDWQEIEDIRLEVPRYDFVYLALERGYTPWFGGDEAPGDWKQSLPVLFANGKVEAGNAWTWGHYDQKPYGWDIIGYTRKATSTALPLAHPAAKVPAADFARQQADHWLEDMQTPSLDAKHVSLIAMAENCIRHGMSLAHPAAPQGEGVDANGNMTAPVERAKYEELERDFAAIRKDYGAAAYLIVKMRERWTAVSDQLGHIEGGMFAGLEDAASAMASICDNPRAALAPAAIASGREGAE